MRVITFVSLLLSLIAFSDIGAAWDRRADPTATVRASPSDLPTLAPMVARAAPAVVNISVEGSIRIAQNPFFQDPLFRRFFNIPQGPVTERFQAVGSGVIVDATRGYVLTNNHVVRHAEQIQVTLQDRRQLDAKVVGTDAPTDIAVLKIQPNKLTALPMGESKDLMAGDYVVAIGNPYGLGQTATFGIVSALGRTGLAIGGYEDFIQTDASINPGNSGGALVNVAGELIGMNTAILSQSGGNIGIGFAIPVDMVEAISKKLIASGRVSRGELGVRLQKLTPLLAKALEVADKGALVADVVPDSAAAKAGLEAGDVITKLDGAAVTDPNNLRLRIGEKSPGTAVRLTLRRDGQEKSVTATLTALQPETADASPPVTERHSAFLSGLDIGPISRADRAFGKLKGVYVERIEPMSTAALAGLQKGDVITAVNHRPVGAVRQFERDVLMRAKGQALLLNVRRDGSSMFIAIE